MIASEPLRPGLFDAAPALLHPHEGSRETRAKARTAGFCCSGPHLPVPPSVPLPVALPVRLSTAPCPNGQRFVHPTAGDRTGRGTGR
ncbi:hypothetical protein SLA_6136 [Streptomyces laurentii]|uniref:Uncharacterized protein n=1 Tax=Streptomyces laurentii TaxID=39478 RepID=A0A160P7C2_STRLU|nr:hypothetical protein SLA_6136 [Streptomyces laurentii]